jgi:hypothetical protein
VPPCFSSDEEESPEALARQQQEAAYRAFQEQQAAFAAFMQQQALMQQQMALAANPTLARVHNWRRSVELPTGSDV